jgi:hypothetical protein
MWLHGGTSIRECNQLERWLVTSPPLSKTAQIPAMKVYRKWKKSRETKGEWGAYYEDCKKFRIPTPKNGEWLIDFVVRLTLLTKEAGKGHHLEWRALKSFLDFIRTSFSTEEAAFIEHIFPKKMDLYFGEIIRIIPSEAYPIPEKVASELIIELAQRCRNHRRLDARLTAAESLGLSWLCITASRLRFPTYVESLMGIELEALQCNQDLPQLQVPTLYHSQQINSYLSRVKARGFNDRKWVNIH